MIGDMLRDLELVDLSCEKLRNCANHDANKEGRFCMGITTDLEQPLSGVLNTSLRCARLI
jgi:hypothetical protein